MTDQLSKAKHNQAVQPSWGAHVGGEGTVFRLWAPDEDAVKLRLAGADHPMAARADGWFELWISTDAIGEDYLFVLSDGLAIPDPASRAQSKDVHGPSRVAGPNSYRWRQHDWRGRPWEEAVIYELHIGTFTREGTFQAAIDKLTLLAEIGITVLEVMPVAHFSGERGWGYDGVLHYAPHSAYGTPEDMKAFIDAAHALGMMVLLDVVYNHFGPEGNYLHRYAPSFFRADRQTPWGAAIDFGQEAVRRYFIDNALYWIGEFRLDGLRLDAVEQIHDASPKHVLTEIAETVRSVFADRQVHLVVEDQRNYVDLLKRNANGEVRGYTAEWNDDFHHVAHVIATGEKVGHYKDFSTNLSAKLAKALCDGFIYTNRDMSSDMKATDARSDTSLPPSSFIDFLQNHDQIGNRAFGERLLSLADESMVKALTAIMLLSPQIPFLFMGEEFGETQPFYFFCDYTGELGEIVRKGRIKEAEGFGGLKKGRSIADLPDPNARNTFDGSKLQWGTRDSEHGRSWLSFISELLEIRREYLVPLLAHTKDVRATTLSTVEDVVAVSWTFGDEIVELRANLSTEPKVVPAWTGNPVFLLETSDDIGSNRLAAHSVLLCVHRATERSS
ncbi:malto-oligosyltrehalose trehalohydrolase [Rhizobium tubonense]|uniref:Malto-oligosyltrehalose trehalohydrolase n=1 Tax=Rhizobium tubonense TaxID=484088 RepID=A0A2W4CKQ7_9HYPH|nr:malto-oligosyltrehalose trehalohydrolase [Rhizobium tubonense]PZM11538.1 malto-oligosyltrehalose trehalohydrolase [Rhizobium tubonense]